MSGGKDHPGVIAPPPLIYLGFLLAGWALAQVVPDPGLGLTAVGRRGVALVLIVAGLIVDGVAAGHFRRLGTNVEPWKPSTALATGGLYRFSRNPIYVGFALVFVGFAVAMDSLVTLALLIPCLVTIDRLVIMREETYLAARFGEAYAVYRKAVRRWL